jgi:hypothetical protein
VAFFGWFQPSGTTRVRGSAAPALIYPVGAAISLDRNHRGSGWCARPASIARGPTTVIPLDRNHLTIEFVRAPGTALP